MAQARYTAGNSKDGPPFWPTNGCPFGKWTVASATTMTPEIPRDASRVRRPMIKAMPPPNSDMAAKAWRIAGMVASGLIQPIGFWIFDQP